MESSRKRPRSNSNSPRSNSKRSSKRRAIQPPSSPPPNYRSELPSQVMTDSGEMDIDDNLFGLSLSPRYSSPPQQSPASSGISSPMQSPPQQLKASSPAAVPVSDSFIDPRILTANTPASSGVRPPMHWHPDQPQPSTAAAPETQQPGSSHREPIIDSREMETDDELNSLFDEPSTLENQQATSGSTSYLQLPPRPQQPQLRLPPRPQQQPPSTAAVQRSQERSGPSEPMSASDADRRRKGYKAIFRTTDLTNKKLADIAHIKYIRLKEFMYGKGKLTDSEWKNLKSADSHPVEVRATRKKHQIGELLNKPDLLKPKRAEDRLKQRYKELFRLTDLTLPELGTRTVLFDDELRRFIYGKGKLTDSDWKDLKSADETFVKLKATGELCQIGELLKSDELLYSKPDARKQPSTQFKQLEMAISHLGMSEREFSQDVLGKKRTVVKWKSDGKIPPKRWEELKSKQVQHRYLGEKYKFKFGDLLERAAGGSLDPFDEKAFGNTFSRMMTENNISSNTLENALDVYPGQISKWKNGDVKPRKWKEYRSIQITVKNEEGQDIELGLLGNLFDEAYEERSASSSTAAEPQQQRNSPAPEPEPQQPEASSPAAAPVPNQEVLNNTLIESQSQVSADEWYARINSFDPSLSIPINAKSLPPASSGVSLPMRSHPDQPRPSTATTAPQPPPPSYLRVPFRPLLPRPQQPQQPEASSPALATTASQQPESSDREPSTQLKQLETAIAHLGMSESEFSQVVSGNKQTVKNWKKTWKRTGKIPPELWQELRSKQVQHRYLGEKYKYKFGDLLDRAAGGSLDPFDKEAFGNTFSRMMTKNNIINNTLEKALGVDPGCISPWKLGKHLPDKEKWKDHRKKEIPGTNKTLGELFDEAYEERSASSSTAPEPQQLEASSDADT